MKNPWFSRNPFLSLWLSGANAVFGAVRGRAVGETQRQTNLALSRARRQTNAALAESMRQATQFWAGAAPPHKKRKRRRR